MGKKKAKPRGVSQSEAKLRKATAIAQAAETASNLAIPPLRGKVAEALIKGASVKDAAERFNMPVMAVQYIKSVMRIKG